MLQNYQTSGVAILVFEKYCRAVNVSRRSEQRWHLRERTESAQLWAAQPQHGLLGSSGGGRQRWRAPDSPCWTLCQGAPLSASTCQIHVNLIKNVLIFQHMASEGYHLWPAFQLTAFLVEFPRMSAPIASVCWYIITYQQCSQSIPLQHIPYILLRISAAL